MQATKVLGQEPKIKGSYRLAFSIWSSIVLLTMILIEAALFEFVSPLAVGFSLSSIFLNIFATTIYLLAAPISFLMLIASYILGVFTLKSGRLEHLVYKLLPWTTFILYGLFYAGLKFNFDLIPFGDIGVGASVLSGLLAATVFSSMSILPVLYVKRHYPETKLPSILRRVLRPGAVSILIFGALWALPFYIALSGVVLL